MSIYLVNGFDTAVCFRNLMSRKNQEIVAAMLQPPARTPESADPRAARHAALLAEAAQEFNARGIAGASVARIAKRLGLSRAAVYYYVADRNDLAVQCYRHTCAVMAADLAAAAKAKRGLDKVFAFLRLALDPERPPLAALTELEYLKDRDGAEIAAAHAGNVETLRHFIRAGMVDGSIRACDDEIAAQTLIGTITWIPLSVDWVEGTDGTYRARTVEALIDVLNRGEATDPGFEFVPPVAIVEFFPPASNAFDRRAASAAKVEQLLMTASQLFNRRGIDGTSLDDITAELGATKGALYHHLKSKGDLVVRCYRRGFTLYERFADTAEAHGRNGLDRGLIGLYLNVQAHASGLSPLIQMVGASALPAGVRREITRRARALQRRFMSFGKEGLKDGSFRRIDFDAVAQLGAGAFQWLPKWFSFDDPRAGEALARQIVDLFIRGLRAR